MRASSSIILEAPDGTPFEVYLATADEKTGPALIIFSPIFGVDHDVKVLADRWAARGYTVAAPDYFAHVEPGVIDRSAEGRERAFARWNKLDVDRAVSCITVLRDRLLAEGHGQFGALGYCAGGEIAFLCGTRLGVKAVATFHGTRIDRHLDEARRISAATLHFGGNDSLVSMQAVDAIRGAFDGNRSVDIRVYPGAEHGFSFEGRPSYDKVAATESDRYAQELFATLKQ
jgi:carboxymethylenebutenolidase